MPHPMTLLARLLAPVALLATMPLAAAFAASPARDRVVLVDRGDAAIVAARARARAGLDAFFARLAAPGKDDIGFSLKFDLNHRHPERGAAEIIWARQVTAEGGRIWGVLDNRPQTPGFTIGERVEIPWEAITDWAIRRGERFEGHYSTRALFPVMTPPERAAVAARLWPE